MKTTKRKLRQIIREEALKLHEAAPLRSDRNAHMRVGMTRPQIRAVIRRHGLDPNRGPSNWFAQEGKYGKAPYWLRTEYRKWRKCHDNPDAEGCPKPPPEPVDPGPEDPLQSWDPEYHHAESDPIEKKYGPFKIPKKISNHLYKQIEYAIGVVEYGDTASIGAEVRDVASGAVDVGTFFANLTIGQLPIVTKLFADAVRMSCDMEEGTCNIEILKRKYEELNIKLRDPKFVPDIQQRNMGAPYFILPDWMHVNLDQDAPKIPSSGVSGRFGGREGTPVRSRDALRRYGGDIEHPKASPDHPQWIEKKAFEWTRDALEKLAKEGASYPPKTKPERISPEVTDQYKFTPTQARRDGETMLRKALDHASGMISTKDAGWRAGRRPSPRPWAYGQIQTADKDSDYLRSTAPTGPLGPTRPAEYDFLRGNGYKIFNLAVKEEMYDEARELAKQLLVDREHLIPWDQISYDLLKAIGIDPEEAGEVIDAQIRKNTEKRRAGRSPLQQQRAERANRRYRGLNKIDENKITKSRLKQIVKEELQNVLNESADKEQKWNEFAEKYGGQWFEKDGMKAIWIPGHDGTPRIKNPRVIDAVGLSNTASMNEGDITIVTDIPVSGAASSFDTDGDGDVDKLDPDAVRRALDRSSQSMVGNKINLDDPDEVQDQLEKNFRQKFGDIGPDEVRRRLMRGRE